MRVLFEIFGQTLRTLWAHKLRSFLTMFGIAWGVGSLLLLVGLGEGFRSGNRKQFNTIGENVLFIFSGRAPAVEGSFTGMRPYFLTYKDYEDIKAEAPSVKEAVPVISRGDIRAVSDYYTTSGSLVGVTSQYNAIRFMPIAEGRWFNDLDIQQKRQVTILGDEANRMLFQGRAAVGQTILLGGMRFQIIGTLQRIGRGDNNMFNLRLFVPFTTMAQNFPVKGVDKPDLISMINYQPRTRELHEQARLEVHKIIARNHGFDYHSPDAFDEWDTIRTIDQVGKIFDAMNMFLGSVGLVTLALGAIGIINIMLVAVADRTREIGLRKAIGATNRSIMFQFFVEGAFLTLMSGGLGMAGAAALMAALGTLPSPPGWDTPKLVPSTAALAIGALAIAGVSAGLYPARQAAQLQPVEALRKE
ncbi:MAG TPA: ABC transporter permease [Terriglobales bacterium]|nr:ABC transporter permease [Terriglobales bacterium]